MNEMKINLAAKNYDVKDNNPAGNFYCCFKGIEYKSEQQEQHINHNSRITQYHKSTFQPGQRKYLCSIAFVVFMVFYIPKNNCH
jgi:hypothetical protein